MSAEKTVYSFSECLSHRHGDRERRLTAHLEEVGSAMGREAQRLARTNPGLSGLVPVARLVGLCHDLGKATGYFQEYVSGNRRKGSLSNHSALSALLTYHVVEPFLRTLPQTPCPDPDFLRVAAAVSVFRHHGDVENWGDESVTVTASHRLDAVRHQLEVMDLDGLSSWLQERFSREVPLDRDQLEGHLGSYAFTDVILDGIEGKRWNHSQALTFLYLCSLLLCTDKLDAALEGSFEPSRVAVSQRVVSSYRDTTFHRASGLVNELRRQVSEEALTALSAKRDVRLFTLTAPTGSGKTLTALEIALQLRAELHAQGLPGRIIYCLPYTSIIDQNFEVYEDVLKSGGIQPDSPLLLKHHHRADISYRTAQGDDPEPENDDISELLVESWSSEITVTTFVQLFDSLFSGRNRALKRFMRLPGSVVLLDEVQAIPRRYWESVRSVFLWLSKEFGTRFVLMTATRPLIFREGDAVELLPNKERYFRSLSRLVLHNRSAEPTDFGQFCEEVSASCRHNQGKTILIVLNTIRCSIQLYQYLKERSEALRGRCLCYLSTNITPRDRSERIRSIRLCRHPKVIVSTQLIEAGVDISADIVHRDFAPLDCVIQTCGRCNRSGGEERGQVCLWRLTGQGFAAPWGYSRIYEMGNGNPILLDATMKVLAGKDHIEEPEFLNLADAYFQDLVQRSAPQDLISHLDRFEFAELRKNFALISDDGQRQSYFVIDSQGDPDSEEVWRQYNEMQGIADPLERHIQFLRIKREFFDRVTRVRDRSPQDEVLPLHAEQGGIGSYDRDTGYVYGEGGGHLIC